MKKERYARGSKKEEQFHSGEKESFAPLKRGKKKKAKESRTKGKLPLRVTSLEKKVKGREREGEKNPFLFVSKRRGIPRQAEGEKRRALLFQEKRISPGKKRGSRCS